MPAHDPFDNDLGPRVSRSVRMSGGRHRVISPKGPPPSRIKCIVKLDGMPLLYDEKRQYLMLSARARYTTFPTKKAARHAVWHTVQYLRGVNVVYPVTGQLIETRDFEIEEVE
jgi:hypothetical protein